MKQIFHFHQTLKYWTIVHCHEFYEIFIITDGTVYHIVNEVRQILAKGDMVFIRPEDVHSYEKYAGEEVALLNINFRSDVISAAFSYLGEGFQADRLNLSASLPPKVHLSYEEMRYIWDKYEQIAAISIEYAAETRAATRALLVFMLSEHFFPKSKPTVKKDAPLWLRSLQVEMQKKEHFTKGLDALYRLANVSPEHLSRTVLKHMGTTPTVWINELRLQYSAHLLKHSNIEIVAIALECGFNSLSHFYKAFQQTYIMSPGKYRKMHQRAAIPQ